MSSIAIIKSSFIYLFDGFQNQEPLSIQTPWTPPGVVCIDFETILSEHGINIIAEPVHEFR